MAHQVRPNSGRKAWVCPMQCGAVPGKDIIDAVPGKWLAARALKERLVRRPIDRGELDFDGRDRFRPKRNNPLFVSFAAKVDGWTGQQVLATKRVDFADPSTGVVEEEQQGVVAAARRCLSVRISG